MLEEWIPSLGIGVMVSGFLAFIVGVANCAEAWKENSLEMKKNRLEMEQSKVKLQLEIMKAYREVLKEVREIEKHNWGREEAEEEGRESRQVDWRPRQFFEFLRRAAGKKQIADAAKLEALEQARDVRAIIQEAADNDRIAFNDALESADKRWKDVEARAKFLEGSMAAALREREDAVKHKEDAEIREINAQLRAINSLRRLGQVDRTVKRIRLQRSSETAAP
ncbi:hypothetical protein V2G26_000409 [Clonostachys chloroleuca]